jgi:apolipoprotein N-acyltransferase
MQPYLLAILSGLLLSASFPNTDWNYLAWIALVPFFLAIEKRGWKDTFCIGYLAGVAYYWSLFYWLNNVTVAGFLVLTLYLAIYLPLFGLAINLLRDRVPVPAWFLAPVLWTALEYVRTYAFSGLPWGILGVSQYGFVLLIQIASITGVYGVSFVIVFVNAVLYECILRRGMRCALPLSVMGAVLFTCLAYGSWKLAHGGDVHRRIRVAIVQGNVPQEIKFGEGFREQIIRRFYDLTLDVAREKPDLILWPETSVPGYFWYDPDIRSMVTALEEKIRTPLLLGSVHVHDALNPEYFNSAFLVDAGGGVVARYDKIHLVLFGEYVPCKRVFPFLSDLVPFEEDFTPGKEFTIFPLKKADFGVLICFEDIFPDLARNFVRNGARFLVNITNDAWFGESSQPYQHAAHAVFRCVENSVGMVRATNTGLSCFIDTYGRITDELKDEQGRDIYVEGTIVSDVPIADVRSFYTQRGNVFAVLCCVVTLAVLGILLCTGSKKKGN